MFHCKLCDKVVEPTACQMQQVLNSGRDRNKNYVNYVILKVKCPTLNCPSFAWVYQNIKNSRQYECIPFDMEGIEVIGQFKDCDYNTKTLEEKLDLINNGSFNWYLHRSGDFVTTVAKAIQCADGNNIKRLELAFPQMVAAFKQATWDIVPKNFDPIYNANNTESDAITLWREYFGALNSDRVSQFLFDNSDRIKKLLG